ncbi:MAG TPA: hypothetical protein VMF67_07130 [Rhizomicrobium sp.]|nr:hypothetical protein [Rhizomicrobium sp.]
MGERKEIAGDVIAGEAENKAWEYQTHLDNLYMFRFSYLMIAQSMLVVSYATLIAPGGHGYKVKIAAFAIAAFGLLVSWFQYLLSRSVAFRLEYLRETFLLQHDLLHREVSARRKIPFRNIQSHWIPAASGLLWTIFLVLPFFPNARFWPG